MKKLLKNMKDTKESNTPVEGEGEKMASLADIEAIYTDLGIQMKQFKDNEDEPSINVKSHIEMMKKMAGTLMKRDFTTK